MGRTIEVLQALLPVIAVLGIGVLCRIRGKLTREGVNTLKRVAVDITLPAVLLNAFATAEYSLRSIVIPLLMFGVCIASWSLGRCARRAFNLSSRFVPFLTTGFEAGMLGYTLYAILYGTSQTSVFALVDLGQVLFVFTLYKFLLGIAFPAQTQRKSPVREMLTSPIIIAVFSGVLLGATGLYRALIPSGIMDVFESCVVFIAAPTSVLILLSIGYDLVLANIRWAEVGKLIAVRLFIMLIMMGLMLGVTNALFGYERPLAGAILLMFLLPPPFVLPVFTDDTEQRAYVSSVLSISTLVAVAGFAVLAAVR